MRLGFSSTLQKQNVSLQWETSDSDSDKCSKVRFIVMEVVCAFLYVVVRRRIPVFLRGLMTFESVHIGRVKPLTRCGCDVWHSPFHPMLVAATDARTFQMH